MALAGTWAASHGAQQVCWLPKQMQRRKLTQEKSGACMGPLPGSITYEGCALVNQFNISAPQSADCTVPHCRVVVTARSSGFWWLVQSLGLVIKQEFHQHQHCYNCLNLTCHCPQSPSSLSLHRICSMTGEQKEASCLLESFPHYPGS